MTFKEFKETYDMYGAYNMWETVEDAKRMGDIPESYHDIFKNKCSCGSDNIITISRTQIMCCDPNCKIKQGYKLAKLMSDFGMDGVGPAICSSVYNRLTYLDKVEKEQGGAGFLKTSSHLEMLLVPYDKYPFDLRSVAGEEFYKATLKVRSTQLTFPKLVGMLGLKGFGGSSEEFLKGINSYNELKNEIQTCGGIIKFCAKRGAVAPMKACDLKVALADILIANYVFNSSIRNAGLCYLYVCITGSIKLRGKSITKANFIKECNDLCRSKDGIQIYEIKMNGAIESNPFVLYTNVSSSAKFKRGLARGTVKDDFGEHSVLMTVDDFYTLLEIKMENINKQIANAKNAENVELCTTVNNEKTEDLCNITGF